MPAYEFRVIQNASGAPVTHLNDRINNMAEEGWEVIGMSGDTSVNILLRRVKPQAAAQPQAPAQPPQPEQQG